jgi:hypothetical protein
VKQPKADREQLRDLGIQFSRHGINRRAGRLLLVREHAGRWVDSMSQLSWMEAAALQQRLRRVPVGSLPSHVERLQREEERKVAEWAGHSYPAPPLEKGAPKGRVVGFACTRTGRGRGCTAITEADMEAVRQFGEQLDLLAERGIRPPGRAKEKADG